MKLDEMSDFAKQYCETALWSSTDDGDDNEGPNITDAHGIIDIDPDTLAKLSKIADDFAAKHADDLAVHNDPTMGAHDLWLNQNGHGCGFWDGDWPEPQATRLDDAATALGQIDLYVGDDGKIYGL